MPTKRTPSRRANPLDLRGRVKEAKKLEALPFEKISNLELLDGILAALELLWGKEATKPGLHISNLSGGVIYVAIHRYHGLFGNGRVVHWQTRAGSLGQGLKACAEHLDGHVNEVLKKLRGSAA